MGEFWLLVMEPSFNAKEAGVKKSCSVRLWVIVSADSATEVMVQP